MGKTDDPHNKRHEHDPTDTKPNGKASSSPRIVAIYDYVNESGQKLFEVVRYDPKSFRQRRPDGHGGHVWNLDGVRLVPYRLPELIKAVASGCVVYVVEGEKDADMLTGMGIPATTNPMGAGKWRDEFSEFLRGADVVILPDNDPQSMTRTGDRRFHADGRPVLPGHDHGQDVARRLTGKTADEALGGDGNREQTAKADAVEFLSNVLAKGPVKAKDIEKEARAACLLGEDQLIGQSKPFRSARQALGISSYQPKGEKAGAAGGGRCRGIRCPSEASRSC